MCVSESSLHGPIRSDQRRTASPAALDSSSGYRNAFPLVRTPKAIIPYWLPLDALTEETLDCFEHISKAECSRRARAGLIVPAEPTGRVWRTVPRNRTDDATSCRTSLISVGLSRTLRQTIVSQILQRPLHEVDDLRPELLDLDGRADRPYERSEDVA
jgi:hypothetical protein